MTQVVQPERCRVCGCTPLDACVLQIGPDETMACRWYDLDHTLCTNPQCVGTIPLVELEAMPLIRLAVGGSVAGA
jgi:hypothetical protein